MGVYKHDKNKDKKAGDGLALSEWNDLRNAVAGHSGLGLALTESDNVGIGIDTPDAKLHVEGDTLVHGQLLIGEASKVKQAKLKFEDAYPEEGAKRESAIIFAPDHGTSDHAWIRFHSRQGAAHNLEIQVSPKGEDHLVLNPKGGNVGIGIDAPDTKLHVNGNILVDASSSHYLQVRNIKGNSYSGKNQVDELYLNYNTGKDVHVGGMQTSNLHVNGDVEASKFIGDGSKLTNLNMGSSIRIGGWTIKSNNGEIEFHYKDKKQVWFSGAKGRRIATANAPTKHEGGSYWLDNS